MPKARFYKTLFLPPIEGQHLIWKNSYAPIAGKVDEIVQLGNLVGCSDRMKDNSYNGPNAAVLSYIALWKSTYSNWTQVVGPNEIMALNFPDEWTNIESNRLLRRRWLTDHKKNWSAFLTAGVNKGRLVTHGGLTHGEWVKIGKPKTAEEAAERLNDKYCGTLYQGKCFKLNKRPNFSANPIFADPVMEVYPSWITAEEDTPFDQVHSGGGLNTIQGRLALNEKYSLLLHVDNVRYFSFGSLVEITGHTFLSIAPDITKDKIIRKLPEPWNVYIEKIPVIDMRDDYFIDPHSQRKSILENNFEEAEENFITQSDFVEEEEDSSIE